MSDIDRWSKAHDFLDFGLFKDCLKVTVECFESVVVCSVWCGGCVITYLSSYLWRRPA